MPFLNLDTFSTLFIVSGMAFQRMLPRKAREFMPKDRLSSIKDDRLSCIKIRLLSLLNHENSTKSLETFYQISFSSKVILKR